MNRIYSLSKTFSKQKIGFWYNLDHLGKSLLSNALTGITCHVNKSDNVFMTLVV